MSRKKVGQSQKVSGPRKQPTRRHVVNLPPPKSYPQRTPKPPQALLSLIACFVWVSMGGLVGLLGPAIPRIAKHLGVEDTELGWAFSVRAGGYIIGSLITSRLPERCVIQCGWVYRGRI